jgi:hypothetical protein
MEKKIGSPPIFWVDARKLKGQSRMYNTETLVILGTQDTGWRWTKLEYTTQYNTEK